MLNDSSEEVVVHAWGALRNISVDEGYDQSIFMYRKNILTPVSSALQKVWDIKANYIRKANYFVDLIYAKLSAHQPRVPQ